jgi:DNA mismatch repair protein MutS2
VQTPFGKGVVREVRNNKRLLVDVQDRSLVMSDADVTALDPNARRSLTSDPRKAARRREDRAGPAPPNTSERTRDLRRAVLVRPASTVADIDLHGLTVEEALARVDSALNDALLADAESLRVIHGRGGGKIRAALHRRLRDIPSVRGFRLDTRNEGVTIVTF